MDSSGFFWDGADVAAVQRHRTIPPIPVTGWRPPSEFPNLSAAKALAFDTETWDPELRQHGPGWARGRDKFHVVGFSIAVPDGTAWYFPLRHTIEGHLNLDATQCLRWLAAQLGDNRPKVGANLLYDIGGLRHEGVEVGGLLYDIQNAEPLIDSETPHVALRALAQKYLGEDKETSLLYQWAADAYGGAVNERQRANIYRCPPQLVGPYAEQDAALPFRIMEAQWKVLASRGCLEVFDLETRLIRPLHDMRWRGAPVSVSKAEELDRRFTAECGVLTAEINVIAGKPINPLSSDDIAAVFRNLRLAYTIKEETGNASIPKALLEKTDHPIAEKLLEYREKIKLQSTFIRSGLLESHVNGRVHCSFHQLRTDDNGARSGRLASSDPNLQNIPTRTKEGKLIREAFIGKMFRCYDMSQIEYRLLVHHAVGPGSDEARAAYNDDPDTDYHAFVGGMIHAAILREIERGHVKGVNFGLIYGAQAAKIASMLKMTLQEAKAFLEVYHSAIPYAKATMDDAAAEANRDGYVTTILGRKSDFNLWVPEGARGKQHTPMPYDLAVSRYGLIERAGLYKALNRRLQGGAADVMKKAMVDLYEAGLFAEDACGMPLLTVHDELDFDEEGRDPNAHCWDEMLRLWEACVPCRVPIRVSMKRGPTWADCK